MFRAERFHRIDVESARRREAGGRRPGDRRWRGRIGWNAVVLRLPVSTRRLLLLVGSAVALVTAAGATPLGARPAAPTQDVPVIAPAPTPPTTDGTGTGSVADLVELLPLQTSADRRIVDAAGRDVLLRGANVNSLGEYWQGVPDLEPTIAVTDADWASMAAHGFSVVRLLVTWSRVEPERGRIDDAYLDQVDAAVRAAAAHGLYTVIDMHQDAYTATIATADPADCPSGTTPAKGWDGAPAWATITDGLSTCLTNGERNSSPAVNRAWNNFYDDVDGIRTEFAAMWGAVATRFAGRPEVAGFDLLNEPENPRPAAEMTPVYTDFLAQVIRAIRAAESAAGAPFDHIVFVEPALPAGDQSSGLVIPDPAAAGVSIRNVAGSVHNYAESITTEALGNLTIEGTNDLIDSVTAGLGVANWGGEYGFWDTEPATLAKARRYAADEDRMRWGGAWWQWRQSCGDPHAVQWVDGTLEVPAHRSTHLNVLDCPANTDLGPNDAFLDIVGRGYPRATPGRLTRLRSEVDTGDLLIQGEATEADGTLVVWTPTAGGGDHDPVTSALIGVESHDVAGGRIITARVIRTGPYSLRLGPEHPGDDADPSTPTAPAEPGGATPGTASPADAVTGRPDYTG